MKHIGAVRAVVTAASFDREPTAAELDAIELEMPVIQAEVELLDARILTLDRPVSELDSRRFRRARRKVLAARRALANTVATLVPGGGGVSESLTLDDLAGPLRAMRLLATNFGHLTAPSMWVSTIYPDRLELTFFDGLSDFEVWRDALGVATDAVTYREQNEGRTLVLKASVDYAGAVLELTGYGDVPAPEPVGGAG